MRLIHPEDWKRFREAFWQRLGDQAAVFVFRLLSWVLLVVGVLVLRILTDGRCGS